MILFLNKNDIFRQMLYDEISLSVGFGDVRRESYEIKMGDAEITPPPSPNALSFDVSEFVNDCANSAKKVVANENDGKMKTDAFVPFGHLNEWRGKQWTGPNFKYDVDKSVEANNVYFEKCYDKAIEFIYSLFLQQNKDSNKTLYVHITSAVNAKSISETFDEIRTLIINSNYAENSNLFF